MKAVLFQWLSDILPNSSRSKLGFPVEDLLTFQVKIARNFDVIAH